MRRMHPYAILHCFTLLAALFLGAACGRPTALERQVLTPGTWYYPTDQLVEQRSWYLWATRKAQDVVNGFVDTDKCDSLLHSALLGAGGASVDLSAAREESGRWLRRPTSIPECWKTGGSKSTISRDMLVGVLWYAWMTKDLDMAEELWQYWEEAGWKLGDSDHAIEPMTRIYGTPTLQLTLAELIYQLGGPNHTIRRLPMVRLVGASVTGFRKHLEILDILLWGEMTGGYTGQELSILDAYGVRYPSDALVQLALGNYGVADELLRLHHPADRLPTSADMCSPMAYERDTLQPCPEQQRTHAPIHFLFISRLLLQKAADAGETTTTYQSRD